MTTDTITIFSYPRYPLTNGFYAVRYSDGGNWILYHRSDNRKAVWESPTIADARRWAKSHTIS